MKYKKSELDIFLQERIRENEEGFAEILMQHFNMNKIAWKKLSME